MPRSIWTGAISFGLVSVPVKLYSAVSRKTVRFNQLDSDGNVRIQQKRVNPTTGEEVPYDRLVKGYDLGDDRYVVIAPAELESLDPVKTKTIEIEDFVELAAIDPIYFDTTYYLAPNTGGAKPYRLLLDAMEQSGRVGIARVVLRSKEALCALRPHEGALLMSTLLFADEVVDPAGIDEIDGLAEITTTQRELDIAVQLVESLAGEWDPSAYRDEYRAAVMDLIERKAAGEEIAVQPAAEPSGEPVPDLMAALKASLDAVGKSDGAAAKKPPARRKRAATAKKAPAKKPAAKKPSAKR
jgi:DNA end-binding protein Ku